MVVVLFDIFDSIILARLTNWIDERNSEKSKIDFAYYNDITRIDTVYNAGITYSPYILVTNNDGSAFKVSVGGKKGKNKIFFEDALLEWNKRKKSPEIKLI